MRLFIKMEPDYRALISLQSFIRELHCTSSLTGQRSYHYDSVSPEPPPQLGDPPPQPPYKHYLPMHINSAMYSKIGKKKTPIEDRLREEAPTLVQIKFIGCTSTDIAESPLNRSSNLPANLVTSPLNIILIHSNRTSASLAAGPNAPEGSTNLEPPIKPHSSPGSGPLI